MANTEDRLFEEWKARAGLTSDGASAEERIASTLEYIAFKLHRLELVLEEIRDEIAEDEDDDDDDEDDEEDDDADDEEDEEDDEDRQMN
ncbi:hypothetical protein GCM10023174_31060 [Chelativorans composti]|uniref:Uncharacterized protein n=1 Tax=Chelativorans composti TaxID=768533 RepID=A0ABW5DH88_9HYPH